MHVYYSPKTKETVICFCKDEYHYSNTLKLAINGTIIERLSHANVLSVTQLANLCSNMHVRLNTV